MLDTKDIAFPLTVKLSDYIEEAAKKNNIKLKKLFVKRGFVTGQVNLFIDFYEDKIDEVLSLLDNLIVKKDYKNLGFHARRSLPSSTVRKIFNRTYIKKFEYTFTDQNKSQNDFIIEGIDSDVFDPLIYIKNANSLTFKEGDCVVLPLNKNKTTKSYPIYAVIDGEKNILYFLEFLKENFYKFVYDFSKKLGEEKLILIEPYSSGDYSRYDFACAEEMKFLYFNQNVFINETPGDKKTGFFSLYVNGAKNIDDNSLSEIKNKIVFLKSGLSSKLAIKEENDYFYSSLNENYLLTEVFPVDFTPIL